MEIGFIGAGKVGCSLGKLFCDRGLKITGYYDRDADAAKEAARFTGSASYDDMKKLAEGCDVLFLTVPDGLIGPVFSQLRGASEPGGTESSGGGADLAGRLICHCSGSISSRDVFEGIEETGAFGYSVHPLFAVSSRFETYKELGGAFFSLEGDPSHIDDMAALLTEAGLRFQIIEPSSKTKYHLAAVYASNLVCGLIGEASRLLQEGGFGEDDALNALSPLIAGNVEHALAVGPVRALTGPVERGDLITLEKHLSVCESEEDRQLYLLLSEKLLRLAKEKHPERDYEEMEQFLRRRQHEHF